LRRNIGEKRRGTCSRPAVLADRKEAGRKKIGGAENVRDPSLVPKVTNDDVRNSILERGLI